MTNILFEPFKIKNVKFKNRIIRSSIGGRTAYYTGHVNDAWVNFERTFAKNDVAGIISATITVDDKRWSPLEYPKISDNKFVSRLKEAIATIKEGNDCKYIMQLGDGGYHTQASHFSQTADASTASSIYDFLFGYRNRGVSMSVAEIQRTIKKFVDAAKRVKEIGCDGLEITASKGYLIHQFLNPATNHRNDKYGGSVDKRFQILREIIDAVKKEVEIDENFIFGIKISARDYNYLPFPNLRLPLAKGWKMPFFLFSRQYWFGNDIDVMLQYAQEMEKLGIDYLHITNGFGFINPVENPGDFPVAEIRMFMNSVRHLSLKARIRAILLNLLPIAVTRFFYSWGWESDAKKVTEGINANDAAQFKAKVNIPIIGNGGFQSREIIDDALNGKCDFIAMARPLLANPELVRLLEKNTKPEYPCSFCNKCTARTTLFPLGCYDLRRFEKMVQTKNPNLSERELLERATQLMEDQILEFNSPHP